MTTKWIQRWALAAAIAVSGAYGVTSAGAVESGDTVQFLIPADANQPTPSNDGGPEDVLVYRSFSRSVEARGCVMEGDRPVQSATLVDPRQHAGNPTIEVITTYTTLESHDVTMTVEPGTRVGNLLFVTDCNIVVDGISVAYKKYSGTVR